MRKYNIVVAFGAALFGVLIMYFGRDLSGFEDGVPGESYWPSIIAWLFILLGALQLMEVIFSKGTHAEKKVDLSSKPVRMAYLSALVSGIYGGLLLAVGFVIASLVFVPSMMALMGERKPWVAALVSVGVVGTIYVFFALVFNTTLPSSVFFD